MLTFCRPAVLACVLVVAGCGETTKVTPPSPAEQAAAELDRIAKTGMVDSAIFLVRESLEELKATDPSLATEMLKALDELEQLEDRAKVKELAAEMISKLQPPGK